MMQSNDKDKKELENKRFLELYNWIGENHIHIENWLNDIETYVGKFNTKFLQKVLDELHDEMTKVYNEKVRNNEL